jgi:hypothetical protein
MVGGAMVGESGGEAGEGKVEGGKLVQWVGDDHGCKVVYGECCCSGGQTVRRLHTPRMNSSMLMLHAATIPKSIKYNTGPAQQLCPPFGTVRVLESALCQMVKTHACIPAITSRIQATSTIDLHSSDFSLINPPLPVDNHLCPPSNGVGRRVLYVVQT